MKKFLSIFSALLLMVSPAWADGTIDTLLGAGAITGTESIPIFQTANPAVKTTPGAIGTYLTSKTNTWSAVQTFNANQFVLGGVTGSTQCLQANTSGVVTGTGAGCAGAAPVSSVSNVDSSLTISPTTGLVVGSLNTAHANTWSAVQTFNANDLLLGGVTGSIQCLHASATGVVTGTGADCGTGSGAVTSVSNADGSLTISPTTGLVVGSLNPAHANTWSAVQTFNANQLLLAGVTGSTQCLQAGATGLVTGTGTACGGSGSAGANPTATASDTAVNGVATTFMRSDAAPAVQKTSASLFGLAKVDGTTITATGGVISAVAGGTGTVTSISAGCGSTTSGPPITSSGTISSIEPVTIRTTGGYTTADCGTLVQYNAATNQAPVLPAASSAIFFDTCSIQAAQVLTRAGSDTIGGLTTYSLAAGTPANPTCVKLVANGGSPGDWKPLAFGGSGGGGSGANPTATASDTAVNGVATTFMRSDGAPAVQKTSAAQFGLAKVDGTTITATGGVITAITGGTGTVTSVGAGCGTSTSGTPITGAGSIVAVESVTTRTTGNYAAADCGTMVLYNSATDQTPTIPLASTAGAGSFFDTCSIQHTQTLTASGGDTLNGASTYLLRTGAVTFPTCAKLVAGTGTWIVVPIQGASQVMVQPFETSIALTGCNGSTANINLNLATYFYCTISTGAVTFTVSNPAAATGGLVSSFTLELTNAGSQTKTFMAGTTWPGGSQPTWTTTGLDMVVCSTRDGAVTWRCAGSEINSH